MEFSMEDLRAAMAAQANNKTNTTAVDQQQPSLTEAVGDINWNLMANSSSNHQHHQDHTPSAGNLVSSSPLPPSLPLIPASAGNSETAAGNNNTANNANATNPRVPIDYIKAKRAEIEQQLEALLAFQEKANAHGRQMTTSSSSAPATTRSCPGDNNNSSSSSKKPAVTMAYTNYTPSNNNTTVTDTTTANESQQPQQWSTLNSINLAQFNTQQQQQQQQQQASANSNNNSTSGFNWNTITNYSSQQNLNSQNRCGSIDSLDWLASIVPLNTNSYANLRNNGNNNNNNNSTATHQGNFVYGQQQQQQPQAPSQPSPSQQRTTMVMSDRLAQILPDLIDMNSDTALDDDADRACASMMQHLLPQQPSQGQPSQVQQQEDWLNNNAATNNSNAQGIPSVIQTTQPVMNVGNLSNGSIPSLTSSSTSSSNNNHDDGAKTAHHKRKASPAHKRGTTKAKTKKASVNNSSKRKLGRPSAFPQKLYQMLTEVPTTCHAAVVGFTADGSGFDIHDTEAFVTHILPQYFKMGSFSSFQRQLQLYSFKRVTKGGAYRHPVFHRDAPHLLDTMVRKQSKPSSFVMTLSTA